MDIIKILVIDDDTDWLMMIIQYLQQEKDFLIAGAAHNQEEALNIVVHNDIDIILLDLDLSGNKADGILTALEIIKVRPLKIMITSFRDDDSMASALKTHGIPFVNNRDYHKIAPQIRGMFNNNEPVYDLVERFKRISKAL